MKKNERINLLSLTTLWIAVGVLGRLIPHVMDVTPLTSLCLLSGTVFSRRVAFFLMMIILLLSDVALAYFYHYPIWGSWTFFTYSGFALIIFFGRMFSLENKLIRAIWMTLFSSLFFWLWTNAGVWLLSGMYAKNLSGFFSCYFMAIPFLKKALLGSVIWTFVLFLAIRRLCYFKLNRLAAES